MTNCVSPIEPNGEAGGERLVTASAVAEIFLGILALIDKRASASAVLGNLKAWTMTPLRLGKLDAAARKLGLRYRIARKAGRSPWSSFMVYTSRGSLTSFPLMLTRYSSYLEQYAT